MRAAILAVGSELLGTERLDTNSLRLTETLLRHAAEISDGVVLIALGAGHLSKEVLAELRQAAAGVPVVITCSPDRSSMLFATYGFEGAERDIRASGAICAPFLAPAAARMALLCALGADLDRAGIAQALAPFDAR